MRLKRLRRAYAGQGGDTIVEVLISIVILAVVIGAAYAISTRSFQAGLNSKYRDQALSYAQQQIELLKNIDNSGNIATFTENPNLPFCVNPDDLSKITPPGPTTGCTTPVGAPVAAAHDQYNVTVTYTGNGPSQTKTFNVTVNWTSASNIASQTKLYYKSNDSWVNTPGSCADAEASSAPCNPTITATPPPPAGLSFSANPLNVAFGGTTQFTWNGIAINPAPNPCTASGAWSGNKPANATNSPIGPLTTTGDNVFTLTCPGIDGSTTATKSVTVTVAALAFPTTGILDNFNRANSTGLGANWTAFRGITAPNVISNTAGHPTLNATAAAWNPGKFGPNCEVYATVPTLLDSSLTERLYLRISAISSTPNGYMILLHPSTSEIQVYRLDSNVATLLKTFTGQTIGAGDSFGASMIGSIIRVYYKVSGGSWVLLGNHTDTTYSAAGYLGLSLNVSAARMDDFGGGTRP